MLQVRNLHVSGPTGAIIKGLSLDLYPGKVHALMGPNGSGKSTFAAALMASPDYTCTAGSITINGQSLLELSADKRARLGLFLAFQHPFEIPGVSVATFLREAYTARHGASISVANFMLLLHTLLDKLGMDRSYAQRPLNVGFSGGEKKRMELVQILLLKPDILILDELDSGLDSDGLRLVAVSLEQARQENPRMSMMIITHYQRMLQYMVPDYVHIMSDGVIALTGTASLADRVEAQGYHGILS